MITKNYLINNNKIVNDINLSIFSDIHYSNIFKLKKFDQLIESLIQNKPDYICIPGDIIDMTNILSTKEKRETLLAFFKKLGSITKTFVSLGNHDIVRIIKKEAYEDKNSFWINEFSKLKKYNVFLLDNDIYEEENIRFIGYNPAFEYYHNKDKKNDISLFKDDFKKFLPKLNNQKINILLCHTPVYILNENVVDEVPNLKNIDVVISGHMHNGMVPRILDKVFPKNRGLIAPNRTLFPDNARGIKQVTVENKEITLLISGAITKIQETAPKILHFGNYLYGPQIEYLKIKKN